MESFSILLNHISGIIWGPLTLTLLLGVGIYLTVGLRAMPWRHTITAFKLLWCGRHSDEKGDITPFQALIGAHQALQLPEKVFRLPRALLAFQHHDPPHFSTGD